MSSLITYDHSQNQRQRLDEGRISLKEEILAFLKNEDAQVDLIKQSYSLLSKYPNLASLKSRIKYPEEISLNLETAVQDDKVIQDSDTKDCVNLSSSTAVFGLNIKDLTSLIHELENVSKTTHEIGTELLALANTAKDLSFQFH